MQGCNQVGGYPKRHPARVIETRRQIVICHGAASARPEPGNGEMQATSAKRHHITALPLGVPGGAHRAVL